MSESNRLSYTLTCKKGLERINKIVQQVGLKIRKEVITACNEKVKKIQTLGYKECFTRICEVAICDSSCSIPQSLSMSDTSLCSKGK